MTYQRVTVNRKQDLVVVTCPKCSNSKVMSKSLFRKNYKRIVAKCRCKSVFHVTLVGYEAP